MVSEPWPQLPCRHPELVAQILEGFGFDRVFAWLGFETRGETPDAAEQWRAWMEDFRQRR